MPRRLAALLLALAVVLAPGCAALASLDDPSRPFGGARFHLLAMAGQADTHCADWRIPQGVGYWLLAPFTLPGLACALSLDLLLLPFSLVPDDEPGRDEAPATPRPLPPVLPVRPVPVQETPPDAKPCARCGLLLWSDWADCPRCGTDQPRGRPSRARGKSRRRSPTYRARGRRHLSRVEETPMTRTTTTTNYRGTWQLVEPEQIIAFREQHALSQAQLGKLLGVTYQAVNNWERGSAVASIANQARLASLLGRAAAPVSPAIRRLHETGTIVQGMLQARTEPLALPELVHLIRAVRTAVEADPSPN